MEIQEVKEQLKEIFRTVINNDKWITIHPNGEDGKGRHLLLKDGETPKEAIERTYGKGEKSQTQKGKEEKKSTFKPVKGIMQSLKDDYEAGKINAKEVAKELSKANLTPYLLDDNEALEKIGVKQSDTKEESKKSKIDFSEYSDAELEHAIDVYKSNLSTAMEYGDAQYNAEKDMLSEIEKELGRRKAQPDTKDGKEETKKEYNKKSQDMQKELDKKYQEMNKKWQNGEVDYSEVKKFNEWYENAKKQIKEQFDKEETEHIADLRKDMSDEEKEFYGNPDTKDKQPDLKGENEKYRSRFPDIQNLIGTLSKDDKYFDSKYRTAEKRLNEKLKFAKKELKERDFADMPSVKKSKEQIVKTIEEEIEKLKAIKDKVNNNKEQDMALLEELKKLIFKVENSKENEEMIDNEKVDKRKLIDEVAGIMKSAGCDDEDIRTAIGKMEKIGYDKSEDGSADNKKVKNEEPEKKDDVDNKKVKNEDAEDEKKVDELKKEEKEDVDNKCKNSKSSFDKINEIYNSIKQVSEEKTYVSRQEKLDNAVEYFK